MSSPPGGSVDRSAGPLRPARPSAHSDEADRTERLSSIRLRPDQPARGQRTRRTVDLTPATHRALDIWQRDAADRLGVARVTGQEVLTALIDRLLADPNLGAQVVRAISDRR